MKRRKRCLQITVKPSAQFTKELLEMARALDRGIIPAEPHLELSFTDGADMLSTLSKKRMELLTFLRKQGAMNIRQLAQKLKRDYSNVHGDIQLLLRLGLVEKNRKQEIFVPWDELKIELPLAA
jgi:predicted transcriptional regulator